MVKTCSQAVPPFVVSMDMRQKPRLLLRSSQLEPCRQSEETMSLTHNHQLHPSEEVIENHQQRGEYIAKKQLLAKVTTFLRFIL